MNKNKEIIKNLTILYIEDDEQIRISVTDTLKLLCNNVISLENANDAYVVYKDINPNIIISDIIMEEMNGIEFFKKVRSENRDIPLIVLSASTNKDFLLDAIKLKLIDYLIKPITFKKLESALDVAVEYLIENGLLHIKLNDELVYDISYKALFRNEHEIKLTPKELLLLELLIKNRNKTISANEIKALLWEDGSDSALKSLIYKLRLKIGKETLLSSSGIGFKLKISSQ